MPSRFTRVAVASRGQAARRMIEAVHASNRTRGTDMRAIALVGDRRRDEPFVREADEVCEIGATSDPARLEQALRRTRADALWSGWGDARPDPGVDEICRRLGVVAIGPHPSSRRLLGDKVAAKFLAQGAGVPVGAWSGGAIATVADARRHAKRLGFPLVLKAAVGHGARAMRRVRDEAELDRVFDRVASDAVDACGEGALFLERAVEGARLVEVDIVGDRYGGVWAVGVRDATVQRSGRTILREAPPPALSAVEGAAIREAAVRLGGAAGYEGAATVEFLVDPALGTATFLEANPGFAAEHAVTEAWTGLDLLELQLHVARGGRLEGAPPSGVAHAVGAHLHADLDGAPAGRVAVLRLPSRAGVRVDRHVHEGDMATRDAPLATIVVVGRSRPDALRRLARALRDTAVVVDGATTNRDMLLGLLDRPEVRDARLDVEWLDRIADERAAESAERPPIAAATVAAALPAHPTRRPALPMRAAATAPRARRSRSRS